MTTCPECARKQVPGAQLLRIDHTNECSIRAAEDSTAVADAERAAGYPQFTRPATVAEQALLVANGFPAPLTTAVQYPTGGSAVRVRSWRNIPTT